MKKIKILIACHKPCVLVKNEILTPIHVGRQLAREKLKTDSSSKKDFDWMFENMIGDDTGENISSLNDRFCETTALYWAWKNYDKLGNPDYIGFMHYRRHIMFSSPPISSTKDCIKHARIDEEYKENIGLTSESIQTALEKYDIITHAPIVLGKTIYSQFEDITLPPYGLNQDIYDAVIKEVKAQCPELKRSLDIYLKSKKHYWYNCFVMPREVFFKFCEFLFKILLSVEKKTDYSQETINGRRALAYIAERLWGFFFTKFLAKSRYKINFAPISFIENLDLAPDVSPAFKNPSTAVNICFSSDNMYAPYLGVTIKSVIENSSKNFDYNIFILDDKISKYNKTLLSNLIKDHRNFSVCFIDINYYLTGFSKKIFYTYSHFSISTYLRFFIPTIFKNYEKILYLDSDLVVNRDVAELYQTELGDNLLAASHDLVVAMIARSDGKFNKYAAKKLGLNDTSGYFQAGVLLFNVKQMIEENIQQKLFERLVKIGKPTFVDQCVLNSVCYKRVKYFDPRWNFNWYISAFVPFPAEHLSASDYNELCDAARSPYIVHFAGTVKPWQNAGRPLAEYFWQYARQTAFYEGILYRNLNPRLSESTLVVPKQVQRQVTKLVKLVARSKIRRVAIYGAGTFGKALLPKLRARGIQVVRIVDSSAEMAGVKVDKELFCDQPKTLLQNKTLPVVIASAAFSTQIRKRVHELFSGKPPRILAIKK